MDVVAKKQKRELPTRYENNKSNQFTNMSLSAHLSTKMQTPPSPPAHDPYEFMDEPSSNTADFTKRALRASREDSFSRLSPFNGKQVTQQLVSLWPDWYTVIVA